MTATLTTSDGTSVCPFCMEEGLVPGDGHSHYGEWGVYDLAAGETIAEGVTEGRAYKIALDLRWSGKDSKGLVYGTMDKNLWRKA